MGVGNGTDALELALRALRIGPGDEVITVANAGGYGTTAIRCAGADPVYVDVHPDSMSMDPAAPDRPNHLPDAGDHRDAPLRANGGYAGIAGHRGRRPIFP